MSPPPSSSVVLLLQEEVHRSNVRPRPDGSEVYRGVSAPKRKAVNDAPQLEEMPKVQTAPCIIQKAAGFPRTHSARSVRCNAACTRHESSSIS